MTVQSIESVIDTGDLSSRPAELLERNGVAEVVLRTRGLLALDEHRANPLTGRFVLVEDHLPVGGGIISMEGYPDQRELITRRATNITMVGHGVAREARMRATATRAAYCGSPACPAPASRRSRWRSRRACSPRATTCTCSTATTSATA